MFNIRGKSMNRNRIFRTLFVVPFAVTALFIAAACNGSGARADSGGRKLVRASAAAMPDWAVVPRQDSQYVYFAGSVTKAADIAAGRQQATVDALYQLVSYIGLRANVDIRENVRYREDQDVSSYISEITRQVGAVSQANVTVEVVDYYYETYSDGTIDMYILIRFPKSWIDRERARIAAQVKEQRATATAYLATAHTALSNGNVAKALDSALSAYYVAIQAAENGDLYDESKNMIYSLLGGLSVKLAGSPKYVFKEGGSDPVEMVVVSSATGKPVPGLKMDGNEPDGLAKFVSTGGYSTDANGHIVFSVSELTADLNSVSGIEGVFTFSLDKMQNMKTVDPDFYDQISKLRDASALRVKLAVANKSQVAPTAVVVVSAIRNENRYTGAAFSPAMVDAFSSALSSMGYNILAVEVSAGTISSLSGDDAIKEAVVKYIKSHYPNAVRICYAFESITDTGPNPYNASLRGGEVKIEVTLVELDTGEVIGGASLLGRGYGLNLSQAAQMAEQKIRDKLPTELTNL